MLMNRLALFFALLFLFTPVSLGQGTGGHNILKNSDFERFSGDTPTGWESTNIPGMLTLVSRSSQSHGGKSSVKCEVKDFYGTKMAGMLCLKDVKVSGISLTLNGFYLLRSVGKDVGFFSVAFKNAQGSAVGSVEEFLPKSSSEFIPFTKTVPIPEGTTKLDIHLTLLSGAESGNLHEGSYALFDDMELIASAESIETTEP